MSTKPFAHLHVHTEYSFLDGMSRIDDLVSHTKELGMDSVAITDHGAMYGVMDFYRACKKQDVKPIIGLEAYMAARGMEDRHPQKDKNRYHLLLIAENQTGYQNLLKIASASQLKGYYYKPRIDKDFLAEHSEGLICTSGCLAAEIPQMLMAGQEDKAKELLGWHVDVFGKDRFFIELQHHDIPELHQVNKALYELGPYADVGFLATNDVHYVRQSDADIHDILLCIQTGALVSDEKRMRFTGTSFYMRSPQEMWDLFGEIPESLTNTVRVAEMCNVNLDTEGYKLPNFPVPEGFTAKTYLRELCLEGLQRRYGDRAEEAEVKQRLEHELHIIDDMGFNTYFLIVWDMCEYARDNGIWWNVRGSGAGSVVAYSLGITSIDPLRNSLIFERFLNPGRQTMPDIDLDYPDDKRAAMIQYCVDKYGEDKVAQIITFGTLGARAAVRDVGRTLDIPLNEVDQLARTIPAIPGKPVSLQEMLDDPDNPEFQDFLKIYNEKDYLRDLIDNANKLEGITRHASTHAAGVLVSDAPLIDYIPLNRPTSKSNDGLETVSQWPMEIVESIGLLKVDFLGLRTLTVMRKACEMIEEHHGIRYTLEDIPYRHLPGDTPEEREYNAKLDEAFRLLTLGNTGGVFQVEGEGMTRTLMNMRPSLFEHIIAAISLYRPGPLEFIPSYIRRMHGEEEPTYHHEKLKPILAETYGIIVYQEQIMQIASQLFGYDLGEADLMRRAVAKKKKDKLMKHQKTFAKKGPEFGVDKDTALKIFDEIEFFARYGFNKSHAADYAVLTVQTAYLKAHFPHEYMAALLTLESGDSAKVSRYINECRHMEVTQMTDDGPVVVQRGIDVLPPAINTSHHDFFIEETETGERSIRFGLDAIKNVGEGAVETILQARGHEPFVDLDEFCTRVDLRNVGKRALECLIKVGAFDDLGHRAQLLASLERLMGVSTTEHKAADVGQISLFGEATGVSVVQGPSSLLVDTYEDIPKRDMLQWERELVGVYITEHPLDKIKEEMDRAKVTYSSQLNDSYHDKNVTMAGVVIGVRPHTTRTGKPMAFAEVEDMTGTISVVVWPRTWEETRDLWEEDKIIFMQGRVDAENREPKLLCESATTQVAILDVADEESIYEEPEPTNGFYQEAPPEDDIYETWENGDNGSADDEIASTDGAVHIRIHLERSDNNDRDARALSHIHGMLYERSGSDTFSIVLHSDGRSVEVNFKEKTCYDEVAHELQKTVHPEMIEIIPLDDEKESG